MTTKLNEDVRIEGIRKTNAEGNEWAIVLSAPGESVVPERSPRVLILGSTFRGRGARGRAIRSAGTNKVLA